jgi:hypothetical protein
MRRGGGPDGLDSATPQGAQRTIPRSVTVAGWVQPGYWQRFIINLSSLSNASRARNGDNPGICSNLSQPSRGIRRP